MILRHFPSSYKISVDQRPPIVAKSLLSPAALALFRERDLGKKSDASINTTSCAKSLGAKAASNYLQIRILRLTSKGLVWSRKISRLRLFSTEMTLD